MKKERIKYLDVARALGIFLVYLGHYGNAGGFGYPFAYYCVPLFFFLSGCSEGMGKDLPIVDAIKRKAKTILIPWMSFAVMSIIVMAIDLNSYGGIVSWTKQVAKGCIRNEFFAGGLWFLTCLFIMSVLLILLKKTQSKVFMIIVSLLLTAAAETVMPNNPRVAPSLLWNIDSAMTYFVYYVLGYVMLPYVNKFVANTIKKVKVIKGIICIGATVYSGAVFWGYDLLGWLSHIPIIAIFQYAISSIVVITFFLVVANILEEFEFLQQIGRDTLFLCGSEFMVKTCIEYFFNNFGFTIQFSTPISVYIWAGFLLVVATRWIVPIEKVMFKKLRIM